MGENNRVCPIERAGGLETRLRKLVQNPQKILRKYIKEGMIAVDLGCGPGFFSVEMAKMVGESGKLIAVDLQEGMLNILGAKIQGKEIEKRIVLHQCEEDKIGISGKVDFVLAFYMFHEVPNQKKLLEEIKSVLKPNGVFFLVEPKLFHVSKEDFEKTIKKAIEVGFR
ncbi:class I SAM-dependent methyltransferase [bacterium]|nr:class I SAM-dependent methyltransferase [bacterium]